MYQLRPTNRVSKPVRGKIHNLAIEEVGGDLINLFNSHGTRVEFLSQFTQL